MISPILPPVIISDAITSVYIVIAVWMPVTVVPRSFATVAIAVFMTVVSSAITNWPAASVSSTMPVALVARPAFFVIACRSARTCGDWTPAVRRSGGDEERQARVEPRPLEDAPNVLAGRDQREA